MGTMKRDVKIMKNNIHAKTDISPPHSKLKSSNQVFNPFPEIVKKKTKKEIKK